IHMTWPPFSKNPLTASTRSEFGVNPPNVSTYSSKLVTRIAWPTGPRSVMPTAAAIAVGSDGMLRSRGSSSRMTTLDAKSSLLIYGSFPAALAAGVGALAAGVGPGGIAGAGGAALTANGDVDGALDEGAADADPLPPSGAEPAAAVDGTGATTASGV